jgi:hypothetical protein
LFIKDAANFLAERGKGSIVFHSSFQLWWVAELNKVITLCADPVSFALVLLLVNWAPFFFFSCLLELALYTQRELLQA